MKCKIHVYLLNEHFSQEHADANFDGNESANNRRYDWEDEMRITSEVEEVIIHEYAYFPLQGEYPNGELFSIEVPNMRLFEVKSKGLPSTYIGCSESILDGYEKLVTEDEVVLSLFLKDYEPMANPIPGIYIASQEFPKELIL